MYRCKKCNYPAVILNESVVKTCNCKVHVLRTPITFWEKFFSIFGKKFYMERNAPVVFDMQTTIKGKSNCSI